MNHIRKFICILLCLCIFAGFGVTALADGTTERVVIGADLTEDQILTVYGQFGLIRGSVDEMTVTNSEERAYLEGLVSNAIIGTKSISCVYIKLLNSGKGITVTTNNISWCTESMYTSALMTAGIYDAEVMVTAPFSVSGTAALTGIYKAYEDITGDELDETAKEAAMDELVITAEMTDSGIDEEDAVAIVNDMKIMLDETSDMTDEEVEEQIEDVAETYGYTLDQDTIDKLRELTRTLEGLDISELQEEVERFRGTLDTAVQYFEESKTFWQAIGDFFRAIGNFFANLFGGGSNDADEPEETAEPASTEITTDGEQQTEDESYEDTVVITDETEQTDEAGSETADFIDGVYKDQPESESAPAADEAAVSETEAVG